MSIKMISLAFESFHNSEMTAAQKLVLLALCDHANDEDRTCWPSLNHLERKTGLGRNTVWKAIDALIEKGLVERVKKGSNGPIPEATLYLVKLGQSSTYLGQKRDNPRSIREHTLGQSSTPNRNMNRNRTVTRKSKKIPHWYDDEGWKSLGSKLGIHPKPGENWGEYKNRVKAEIE